MDVFPADWGGAAYIYRAASAAELDPVVVAVRVAGDAAPLAPRVAALARQVDAGLHLRDIVTLDDIVAQEHMRMVGGSVVFGSVLLVALVFSAAGLYALMAVAVARRTREIGIRIALGATPRHVLGSVFARAGRQLGGGIIAGNSLILLLAWRADSLTADLLVTSVITSVIMAAVGVLACAAPARRALRVQPTEALRQVDVCLGTSEIARRHRDEPGAGIVVVIMSILRTVLARLRALRRSAPADHDLDDELRAYVDAPAAP